MKKYLLLVLFCTATLFSNAQTSDWQWIKGASGNSVSNAWKVASDATGNIYVAASFNSDSVTIGSTILTKNNTDVSGDLLLIKYDADGNVIWAKSAGGSKDDYPNAITVDAAGNIFVTGYFTSPTLAFGLTTLTNSSGNNDLFLVKYDGTGNVSWAKSASGDGNITSYSLATDEAGSVYVAGNFLFATATFGTIVLTNASTVAGSNIFLAKYDNNGNIKWAKSAGGETRDYGLALTATTGGICLTGSYGSSSIAFGTTTLNNGAGAGTLNLYLVKYDTAGNVTWAKSAQADDNIFSQALSSDASGNLYVSGFFYSTNFTVGSTTLVNNGIHDMFLIKYDKDGNPVWAKNSVTNENTYDAGNAIASDALGNTYVTGYFDSDTLTLGSVTLIRTSVSNSSLFIVKYDANGNAVWAQAALAESLGLCTDVSGNAYLVGDFSKSSISLGTLTLNGTSGVNNMFVAKYGATSTGVKTISNTSAPLNIYPNPSTGKFIVQLNGNKATGLIEVYDVVGRMVYQSASANLQRGSSYQLDLSGQAAGIYFVQLKSGNSMERQKIVIAK